MDEEHERFMTACTRMSGVGALVGIAYFGLAWLLGGGELIMVGSAARGVGLMVGLPSIAFGVFVAWLAERVAGFTGPLLLLPITLMAVVAVIVGAGLSKQFLGAPFLMLPALSAAAFWGTAAFLILTDRP